MTHRNAHCCENRFRYISNIRSPPEVRISPIEKQLIRCRSLEQKCLSLYSPRWFSNIRSFAFLSSFSFIRILPAALGVFVLLVDLFIIYIFYCWLPSRRASQFGVFYCLNRGIFPRRTINPKPSRREICVCHLHYSLNIVTLTYIFWQELICFMCERPWNICGFECFLYT